MTITVGVAGIGKMGLPILGHLSNANFKPFYYDPNPIISAPGAKKTNSAMELSSLCDVVLIIVGTDQQLEDCLNGHHGLLEGRVKGTIFVIVSTIHPKTLEKVGRTIGGRGAICLDAPVCWGETGAKMGELVSYIGGPKSAFNKCKPILQAYSKQVFFLGPLGSGTIAKTANNHLMWICRFANLEALLLASRHYEGDICTLHEALLAGTCNNRCLERISTGGEIPWAEEDLKIIMELAETQSVGANFAKAASKAAQDENLVEFNRKGLAWLAEEV